jgi:hypothetical protein
LKPISYAHLKEEVKKKME